ncbi:hypothetical protein L5515_000007 [Caenorhabditis briggsae]|uniref:Uncharacterized protein n=2 Tax=Caenorhabditis briggsae TaxID=6238 RepID=A0AAE9DP56_CAEBR|nr:hypothetical protein L3Y34_013913 [Caenorhabditis briggsae]UMM10059.1 hypothetical protein L5515_000007 [Caenorhabditis briggsae]
MPSSAERCLIVLVVLRKDAEKAPILMETTTMIIQKPPSLAEMLEDLKFDDEEMKEAAESADEEPMQE